MANKPDEDAPNEGTAGKKAGDSPRPHAGGSVFQIHVRGHLGAQWSDWLEGLEVELLDDGEMILTGSIPDQAALMGILNKLNRLNLALLSVCEVSKKNKENKMNNEQKLNRRLQVLAWGAFFILWGVTELFPSLPEGIGAFGIGIILLGLNGLRALNGIPASGFTTTLGVIALVLGGLELARTILRLPFELPVFAILLIVLGAIFLGRELIRGRGEQEPGL